MTHLPADMRTSSISSRSRPAWFIFVLLTLCRTASADAPPGELNEAQFRVWIDEMKRAPRGPFKRIRWFCADGAVLPPGEGACRERGGGVQHGERNARALTLRSEGYLVANLLADVMPLEFVGDDPTLDVLRQILLEQFLIGVDDGWIFRRARYYRGAFQAEDEQAGARRLLMTMVDDKAWRESGALLAAARSGPSAAFDRRTEGGRPGAPARYRDRRRTIRALRLCE